MSQLRTTAAYARVQNVSFALSSASFFAILVAGLLDASVWVALALFVLAMASFAVGVTSLVKMQNATLVGLKKSKRSR